MRFLNSCPKGNQDICVPLSTAAAILSIFEHYAILLLGYEYLCLN